MEKLISAIKNDFSTGIAKNNPLQAKIDKLGFELFKLTGKSKYGTGLMLFEPEEAFGKDKKLKMKRAEKARKLEAEINKYTARLKEIKENRIYENAFEWRFEFPEVLDEDGNFTGFDIVTGNPPYIRQEEFAGLKAYLKEHYETYAGTADLYVYFVERGLKVAKSNARFVFILPNKWMRAGYGLSLRKWLKNQEIEVHHRLWRPCLFLMRLPLIRAFCRFIRSRQVPACSNLARWAHWISQRAWLARHLVNRLVDIDQNLLPNEGWTLVNDKVQKLLGKIKGAGAPLGEYVNGKIFYGIKTGYNEAFVIDEKTKGRLMAEDPECEEIIKPFLAGRDIKRYQQPKSEKYLILIKNGQTKEMFGDIEGSTMRGEFYNQIISIPFPGTWNLSTKDYKGKNWRYDQAWQLINGMRLQASVDYYEEFEKPKIIIPAIVKSANYAYDTEGNYGNDKTSIIPGKDFYLLGVISSKLIDFYLKHIASTKQNGYFEYKPVYVSQLPISEKQDGLIDKAVTEIVSLKKQNPAADTSALEVEIDQLVYGLYGLSEEEIKLVEDIA